MSENNRKLAIIQFVERRKYASLLRKIDENGVHADDLKYFYCNGCGTPLEVLSQEPVFPNYEMCSQCRVLTENGWMQEAIQFCGA